MSQQEREQPAGEDSNKELREHLINQLYSLPDDGRELIWTGVRNMINDCSSVFMEAAAIANRIAMDDAIHESAVSATLPVGADGTDGDQWTTAAINLLRYQIDTGVQTMQKVAQENDEIAPLRSVHAYVTVNVLMLLSSSLPIKLDESDGAIHRQLREHLISSLNNVPDEIRIAAWNRSRNLLNELVDTFMKSAAIAIRIAGDDTIEESAVNATLLVEMDGLDNDDDLVSVALLQYLIDIRVQVLENLARESDDLLSAMKMQATVVALLLLASGLPTRWVPE